MKVVWKQVAFQASRIGARVLVPEFSGEAHATFPRVLVPAPATVPLLTPSALAAADSLGSS
jgi:hypothetical protein